MKIIGKGKRMVDGEKVEEEFTVEIISNRITTGIGISHTIHQALQKYPGVELEWDTDPTQEQQE